MGKEKVKFTVRKSDVALCTQCGGTGRKSVYVGKSREERYKSVVCDTCDGSGRVVKDYELKVSPFVPEEVTEFDYEKRK